jgi:hypothetical protein
MKIVIIVALLQIRTVSEFKWRDCEYQCTPFNQVSYIGPKTQIQDNPNMDHGSYHLTMTFEWTYIIRDSKEVTELFMLDIHRFFVAETHQYVIPELFSTVQQ